MPNNKIFTSNRDLFGDPIIYRTRDDYGDILVIDRSPYRSLTFDSIYDQSSMNLRKPSILVHEYTHAMMLVMAFIKPHHATILGLGGGCLLRSIHDIFPKCAVIAVELRQRVYDVASEFFGVPTNKNITVAISDADQWLHNADDSCTNVIFSDMFTAYSMEPLQVENNFISQSHRVLNKKGWLVINYHDIPDLNTPFFHLLCDVFSEVFVYKTAIGNNNIVFASKDNVDSLHYFDSAVLALEKRLGNKSINFFNRLTRLNPYNKSRQSFR